MTISLFWLPNLINHPKDLENVLYERYVLVQEKTCVKLFTNIKKKWCHENPHFGQDMEAVKVGLGLVNKKNKKN